MTTEIITLLGTALGAAITIISVYLNNKFQLKRDDLKFDREYKIEKLKIDTDALSKHRNSILKSIEDTHQIISEIQFTISLTKSVIESSHKLPYQDFDKQYLTENNKLSKIESIAIIYLPEILENVKTVKDLYNNYWGHQRLLLMTDVIEEQQGYRYLQEKIIQISDKTGVEINTMKNELFRVAEKITEKYIV